MIQVSITQLIRHAEQLLPADIESFVAACVAKLDDAAPKGVFADWLDQHDEPDLAWALRWMGRHGKYPEPNGDVMRLGTKFTFAGERSSPAPHAILPSYMIAPAESWRGSFLGVVLAVAERLAWLRDQMANVIEVKKEIADAA